MPKDYDLLVSALAREGGIARARALTPEQRRDSARKAANTRWARYRDENGMQVAMQSRSEREELTHVRSGDIELDAIEQISFRVQNHTTTPQCPCDRCVDAVIEKARGKYLKLLAMIDEGEKLNKAESAFFQMLTGTRPDRWTKVYRAECRKRSK